MTKFKYLVNKVITLSNRPDVVREIETALRDATIELHTLDFFRRDLVTDVVLSVSGAKREVTVPLSNFPRVRRVHSVVPVCDTGCLKPLTQNTDLTQCKCTNNWWRTQGNELIISSSYRTAVFNVNYYNLPNVATEDVYSSWIADEYEYALIDLALGKLYMTLRDFTASNIYLARCGSRDFRVSGHFATIRGEQLAWEQPI